jgi:uncharacterized protein
MSEKSTRLSRLIHAFVDLSFRRPLLVVLAFVLIGGGSAYVATRLVFKGSFVELLPDDAREVTDLNLVAKKAGGDGYLVVQVKGSDAKARRAFAEAASPKLEEHSAEIRYVEYKYDIGFFEKRALLLLPAEKIDALRGELKARIEWEKAHANPLFVDITDDAPPPTFEQLEQKYNPGGPRGEYITSQDDSELYLFVKPTGTAADLEYSRRLRDVVQATCEQVGKGFPGIATDYTGAYVIRLEEDAVMKKDLSTASVLSTVIAIVLILIGTRRGSGLILVLVPVLIGISITFAVAQLTIGHLNVVTGFLVAILIGLGIEYGVHLSMRYWEERRLLPAKEAMTSAFVGTFSGALTSAFTNAAAFFVLLFAKFHAFAQFGFIAGVGVLLTVLAAYAIGPAILALAERIRPMKALGAAEAEQVAARRYRPWPSFAIGGIALSVVAFATYSGVVARSLSFETDLRRLKGNSPATQLDDHIAAQIGVQITPAILLVDDLTQAQVVTELVDASKRAHGDKSAFQKAASLNDLVPRDAPARLAAIEKLRPLLEDLPESLKEGEKGEKLRGFLAMLDAKPWSSADLPLSLRRRFESLDGKGQFVLLFPIRGLYNTDDIQLWADQIHEVQEQAKARSVDLHVLDGNLIAARVFELVKGDGPYILWSAAAAVFVMIWISLRSLKKTLMVSIPLYMGMICLAGGMHLFDVHLNFINAVVLPNLLAIAVDNSVHLYHRYEEEGPGSLGHVVRHTGFAAIIATVSNAAGYGALLIASHQGLRSIGQLAVLGVFCTFMGTTVFFPSVLALLERWKLRNRRNDSGLPGVSPGT